MDSNKHTANIGGSEIKIVKSSKFKGVDPSHEMGFDIEPTATKPNMGSMADIGPTSSMAGLGKQLRDPRDFATDAQSQTVPVSDRSQNRDGQRADQGDTNPQFPVDE